MYNLLYNLGFWDAAEAQSWYKIDSFWWRSDFSRPCIAIFQDSPMDVFRLQKKHDMTWKVKAPDIEPREYQKPRQICLDSKTHKTHEISRNLFIHSFSEMHGPPGVMYVWILETVYTLATCLGEALVDAFAILVSGRRVINLSFTKRKPVIIFFAWVWHYKAISMMFAAYFHCFSMGLPDSWRKVDQSALDMSFTAPRGFFCSACVFFQKIQPVVPKNKKLYGTCWQGFSESRVFLQNENGEIWLNWHFCIIIYHEKWKKTAASSPGLHHGPSWWLKANLLTHVWRWHPIGCLFFGRQRGGDHHPTTVWLQSLRLNNHQSAQWIQCIVVPGRLAKVSSLNHATSPRYAGHI